MVTRIIKTLERFYGPFISAHAVYLVVKYATYVRKGQQQMIADYVMLELVEQGRL